MPTPKLERLIWILVYGGLGLLCLGLFAKRMDDGFGWGLVVVGGVATAVGVVLVWVRSRREE